MNYSKFVFAFAAMLCLAACDDASENPVFGEDEASAVEKVVSSSSVEMDVPSSSSAVLEENVMLRSSYATVASSLFCKTETEDRCEYGTMADARDGQSYKTVKIGDQWWMAQNMNYADSVKTPSLLNGVWCFPYQHESCDEIGRHYTWHAAKGACPDGWHLPSGEEWKKLIDTVGGESVAGKILRSQTGWEVDRNGANGTDAVGFSILPAGYRLYSAAVFSTMLNGFWSASEFNVSDAGFVGLSFHDESAKISNMNTNKLNGYPVRCIKD